MGFVRDKEGFRMIHLYLISCWRTFWSMGTPGFRKLSICGSGNSPGWKAGVPSCCCCAVWGGRSKEPTTWEFEFKGGKRAGGYCSFIITSNYEGLYHDNPTSGKLYYPITVLHAVQSAHYVFKIIWLLCKMFNIPYHITWRLDRPVLGFLHLYRSVKRFKGVLNWQHSTINQSEDSQ